jgi:peroxiredoxin
MKKLFLVLLSLSPLFSVAQDSFHIKGNFVDGRSQGRVYATYSNPQIAIDSADVINGRFQIDSKAIPEFPAMVTLAYSRYGKGPRSIGNPTVFLFLDEQQLTMEINDDFKAAKITGSKLYEQMQQYVDYIKVPGEPLGIMPVNGIIALGALKSGSILAPGERPNQTGAVNKADSLMNERARMERIANEDRNNRLEVRKMLQMKYIESHPDSYFSLVALKEIAGVYMNPAEIEPLFLKLSDRLRQTPSGVAFAARIQAEKTNPTPRVDIGAEIRKALAKSKEGPASKFKTGEEAPDFSLFSSENKTIKLSDFKGKYVLIDFWASWCVPCRKENPNVVEAYKKYRKKGFEVLGVSLERPTDRGKWLEAIKKDKLQWTQVSDLQLFDSPVVKQYGIQAIPQNYLVDPQGKIVAVNLRAEALQEKLAEIFQGK